MEEPCEQNILLETVVTNDNMMEPHNFSISFSHVNYTSKKRGSKTVHILKDICGELKSSRLVAVLGPSGAGKTSMLNILSGFKAKGVAGKFSFNGQPKDLLAFRKMSSYIPQDFALLDLLTVHETLMVSADLKLPMNTTLDVKHKIIDNIIDVLNMNKCRNTLVRDISGGERKRLSIGIELVTNPPIMFFDEPTSGLDSVASLQIIKYLQRLARGGRIIVCSVHQPSSRLIKLFDDLIVVSHGEILYAGPQCDTVEYFEKEGFTCPKYYNPADFVVEVASEEPNANNRKLVQKNKNKYCSAGITPKDAIELKNKKKNTQNPTTIEIVPIDTKDQQLKIEKTKPIPFQYENDTIVRPKEQVGFWRQLLVLLRRSLRAQSRNMMAVQLRLIMHVIIAALLGIVFWDMGNDGGKVFTNVASIFFIVMFVFYGNVMPSILLCPQETSVFLREYFNGWYSMRAYFVSKIVADIPLLITCPTLFTSIVYFMSGQPHETYRFIMCWVIILLTTILAHFFGLTFGSAFTLELAIFLVPALTIPCMIFSGFFIRIHELSAFLRPVCDLSFFRYCLEGLMQAIFGYNRPDLQCNQDFCYLKSPRKLLTELDMYGERYEADVIALIIWALALKVLFFLSLVYRIKRSQ